ncbi:protein jagged-1-like [Cylas formicarius]|uniref:protein jagged-1-like n=1 Tax=Cylas formicarius TaxID=197179 RepID=UPI002958BDA5|nr:protein jagged-1-like [Cylas formicarius]
MMCSVVWRLLCRSMTHGYFLLQFFLVLTLLQRTHGSGFFELQVLEMANPRSELSAGQCCGSGQRSPITNRCSSPCQTFFRLCLKEYQSNVTSTGSCSFGNSSSQVLGRDTFTLSDPDRGKLVLPFTFRWTRSFTLILQAVDHNNFSIPATNDIIEEATYSGIIDPSAEWHTLNHRGPRAHLTYRVRVKCDIHYYNSTCTKFCRPRDDKFGHFICDANGDKECIEGWKGSTCDVAVCKPGCHPVHGKCDYPGECNCRPGWRGDFCDQCEPYPGCKHGYCNGSSWQCICDTNWGGILCDQDLNYCGTHEPCLNGGTCENTAPDNYLCTCPEGFSGANCEVVDNPCAPAPCLHGGTCLEAGGSFSCECTAGWMGPTCNIDIDECASAPCQNGGTCVDLEDAFRCECTPAWEGDLCQFDADECLKNPCINAMSCTNLVGDYHCKCRVGWMGKNCDQNINDCIGQCQHGATCIDLVNDYHCACQPGFTGRDCHTDIDECASNPCRNGGECVDQVNSYRCICPVGITGHECEYGNNWVLDGIRVVGEAISRKQTSLLALTSIVEVKVETALVSGEQPSNKLVIALVCFIIIGLCTAGFAGLLYVRQRRRSLGLSGMNLSPSSDTCHRNHEDEKSNNLQNEENLRRYANPLKEDGSMGSINAASACALDMPRVSVVRPLSSIIPAETSSEMLEMISEVECPNSRKTMLVLPGTSGSENNLKLHETMTLGDGLSPAHRSSQIMLYKAQNPDVRKNTAAFDDSSGHKDFSKSIINVNKQRTMHNTSASADVLTVLV